MRRLGRENNIRTKKQCETVIQMEGREGGKTKRHGEGGDVKEKVEIG